MQLITKIRGNTNKNNPYKGIDRSGYDGDMSPALIISFINDMNVKKDIADDIDKKLIGRIAADLVETSEIIISDLVEKDEKHEYVYKSQCFKLGLISFYLSHVRIKKKEFIEGALKNGYTEQHAADIFEIMIPFAGYGFNKSHAAAYTVLAYRTGYLKCHFPAEFMAANLTNELTSTDGIPKYIEEAKRIGLHVAPPDINKSYSEFDVLNGEIIFAFRGMKGMGKEVADSIVEERNQNGEFKSFMDFLKRMIPKTAKDEFGREKKVMNTKAIEVCIKTGAFDYTGIENTDDHNLLRFNRPTLLLNLERAIEYVEQLTLDESSGQGDLFGSTEEKTFVDFKFELAKDIPNIEKLNMEKEIIGSYVSGHPLDDYKKIIESSVTLTSDNLERAVKEFLAEKQAQSQSGTPSWQNKNQGKIYTILGTITDLKTITTKSSNKLMSFAKLQDMQGSIDLTFFPKQWEEFGSKIISGEVYAFRGRVEKKEDREPSFIVESMEDIGNLKEHAIKEFHIELENDFESEKQIISLKDFLFDNHGSCNIFFHIDTKQGSYIVKANSMLTIQGSNEILNTVKSMPHVKNAWLE